MIRTSHLSVLCLALALGVCAQTPMGPQVSAMPGAGKSFDAFAAEQAMCKQYASGQVAGQADNANARAIGGTLLGAGLGAGLGAAVGGGHGAGVGAAAGGIVGTAAGIGNSTQAQSGIQRQYDTAYAQCMSAHGNPGALPAPAPVVYAPVPQPVYVQPQPLYAAPPPVYGAPQVQYGAPTVIYPYR